MTAPFLGNQFASAMWRVVWVSMLGAIVMNVVYGHLNDWIRLGLFACLTLVAQRWAKRSSGEAVFVYGLGSLAVEFWMTADPSSVLNHLRLHDLGFVMLAGLAAFGTGIQVGWAGGLTTCGLAVLGLIGLRLSYGGQFLEFGSFILILLTLMGVAMNGLYRQLELANQNLSALALLDELTGLENRRALKRSFQRYVALSGRRQLPLLLTSWDVNDLKRINDSQGHAAGDAHLRAFADTLRQTARAEDVCFRLSGDEFIGLHMGLRDGAELARRARARFPAVAVGWVVVTDQNLNTALSEADQMMYQNKRLMKDPSRADRQTSQDALTATGVLEYRATLVLEEGVKPN
jgi:diguanylate cyclase (GGDEF)-like protein